MLLSAPPLALPLVSLFFFSGFAVAQTSTIVLNYPSVISISFSQTSATSSAAISIAATSGHQVSQTSTTPNEATSNTATPSPRVHSSNVRSLVGGIAGGVAAFSIIVSMLFLYWRRRRSRTSAASSDPHNDQAQQPMSGQGTVLLYSPEMTTSLMRPYNPDDPTTFPEYLRVLNPPYIPVPAVSSFSSRNLYTLPKSQQDSRAREYHGLPIVQS